MIDLSSSTDPDIAAGVLQNGVDLDPALFATAQRWVKLSAKDLGPRLACFRAVPSLRFTVGAVLVTAVQVIGIEVKASSAPTAKDARHLSWLRDELGDSFVRGIVFHTGQHPFELGKRIWALPIATLRG